MPTAWGIDAQPEAQGCPLRPDLERRRDRGPIALRNPRRTLQACGATLALGSGAAAFFALLRAGLTLLLQPKR